MLQKIPIIPLTPSKMQRQSILNFDLLSPKNKIIQSQSQSVQEPLVKDARRSSRPNEEISQDLKFQRNPCKYFTTIQKIIAIQKDSKKLQTIKNCAKKIRIATQVKSITSLTEEQIYSFNDQASDYKEPIQTFSQEIDVQGIEFKKLHHIRSQGQYLQGDFYQLVMKVLTERKMNMGFRNLNFFSRIFKDPIRPSHPFLILWNFLKIALILHTFFVYPLQDAFGNKFSHIECENLSLLISMEFFFLVLDIFLRFNMSVYNKGILIDKRPQIAKIYLQRGIVLDLIALCGFMLDRSFIMVAKSDDECKEYKQITSGVLTLLKYTFFLRLAQLRKFLKFLRHELDPQNKYNSYVQLTTLLCLVIMMAHIIASAWIAVGFQSLQSYPTSWISEKGLVDAPWHLTYLIAIYFACMTMTTVGLTSHRFIIGYGDILPFNELEYIVCIIIMLISCAIFAYTLNTITTVLSELNKSSSTFKKDLDIMQNYLIKKGIDHTLQRRVKGYLKMLWRSGQMDPQNQEVAVFNRLSQQIQYDVQLQDKGKQLLKIPFLVNNFSLDFTQRLMKFVREINYSPQEIILAQKSNESNLGLFIVYSGEVDMVFEKQQHIDKKKIDLIHLTTLKQGDYYGIKQLFQIESSEFALRSKDITVLYFVTVDDFMQVLLDQSTDLSDLEHYCMIRDQLLFQNDQDSLYQPCYSCKKEGHDILSCQDLFYQPHKTLAIAKFNATKDQIRDNHITRKSRSKSNSLLSQNFILQQAIRLQRELSDLSITIDKESDEDSESNIDSVINITDGDNGNFTYVNDMKLDLLESQRSDQSWKVDDQNKESHQKNKNTWENQELHKNANQNTETKISQKTKTMTSKNKNIAYCESMSENPSEVMSLKMQKTSVGLRQKQHTKSKYYAPQSEIILNEIISQARKLSQDDQWGQEITNFDVGKNYKIYFPSMNMESVIQRNHEYLAKQRTKKLNLLIVPKQRSKWLKLQQRKLFK